MIARSEQRPNMEPAQMIVSCHGDQHKKQELAEREVETEETRFEDLRFDKDQN